MSSAPAARAGWPKLSPADLALTAPRVEPDADAEALLWDVQITDELGDDRLYTTTLNEMTVKVFTQHGAEERSRVDLWLGKDYTIDQVEGRTIRPDGHIVPLAKADVYERIVEKGKGRKVRAKSFVLPAVVPGAILEYRWRLVREHDLALGGLYDRHDLQLDIPVERIVYHIHPLRVPDIEMRSRWFNRSMLASEPEGSGFYKIQCTDVRAFRVEPWMPPDAETRAWMLLYYVYEPDEGKPDYWGRIARYSEEWSRRRVKVTTAIQETADSLASAAGTPDERLARLEGFCRRSIANLSTDAPGISSEARARLKENKSAAETLAHRAGTALDIDLLFVALAKTAGFDARLALAPDRGDFFFDKRVEDWHFLQEAIVAVRVGDEWRFFDPGARYVGPGMLQWEQEGVDVLLTSGPERGQFVRTPLSQAAQSCRTGSGHLVLAADGALEGDLRVEYTGHVGAELKEWYDDETSEDREKQVRAEVVARMPTAEVSTIRFENVTDPDRPLAVGYHLRVPAYAARTGPRLFFEPAVLQHGKAPEFTASFRRERVYFSYPRSECDSIEIELPPSFRLDRADSPAPITFGSLGEYAASLRLRGGTTLVYTRTFRDGALLVEAAAYPQLKTAYDLVHERDDHTIALIEP